MSHFAQMGAPRSAESLDIRIRRYGHRWYRGHAGQMSRCSGGTSGYTAIHVSLRLDAAWVRRSRTAQYEEYVWAGCYQAGGFRRKAGPEGDLQ